MAAHRVAPRHQPCPTSMPHNPFTTSSGEKEAKRAAGGMLRGAAGSTSVGWSTSAGQDKDESEARSGSGERDTDRPASHQSWPRPPAPRNTSVSARAGPASGLSKDPPHPEGDDGVEVGGRAREQRQAGAADPPAAPSCSSAHLPSPAAAACMPACTIAVGRRSRATWGCLLVSLASACPCSTCSPHAPPGTRAAAAVGESGRGLAGGEQTSAGTRLRWLPAAHTCALRAPGLAASKTSSSLAALQAPVPKGVAAVGECVASCSDPASDATPTARGACVAAA